MRLEEAYKSLGAGRRDSLTIIKKKYHRLMRKYHPDSDQSGSEELLRKAQELNAAYRLIQQEGLLPDDASYMEEVYTANVNELAFCERNIYLWHGLYEEYGIREEEAARGKFYWDPEQEEFLMLLRSVNEVSGNLLQEIERRHQIYSRLDMRQPALHEEFRRELFHLLVGEFVHPYECLEKLVEMEEQKSGMDCYRIRGRIRLQGGALIEEVAQQLKKDSHMKARVTSRQIVLLDHRERELGALSFEEDFFYYIVLPILRSEDADYEIKASKMRIRRSVRPHRADILVDVVLRVPSEEWPEDERSNSAAIRALLGEYERRLKMDA